MAETWVPSRVLIVTSTTSLPILQSPSHKNKRQQQELIAELRKKQVKDSRHVYEGKDGAIEDIITGKGGPFCPGIPWGPAQCLDSRPISELECIPSRDISCSQLTLELKATEAVCMSFDIVLYLLIPN